MKKSLVLAILGVAAGVASSYGQGTVTFQNYFSSASPRITYAATGVPAGKANLALGGSFAAELGWFNGVTADPNQITLLPGSITYFSFLGPAQNAAADGDIYDSGHPAGNGAGWYLGPDLALAGAPAGTTVTLQVFAFNGGSFAGATVNGSSALFQRTLGGGALPPASLLGSPNFTVASVPEPATFALAGLAAAGIMAFRRKKA
jgi:hypothetical protein